MSDFIASHNRRVALEQAVIHLTNGPARHVEGAVVKQAEEFLAFLEPEEKDDLAGLAQSAESYAKGYEVGYAAGASARETVTAALGSADRRPPCVSVYPEEYDLGTVFATPRQGPVVLTDADLIAKDEAERQAEIASKRDDLRRRTEERAAVIAAHIGTPDDLAERGPETRCTDPACVLHAEPHAIVAHMGPEYRRAVQRARSSEAAIRVRRAEAEAHWTPPTPDGPRFHYDTEEPF